VKAELRTLLYEEVSKNISANERITDESVLEKIDQVLFRIGKQENLSYEEKKNYRKILFAAFRGLDILSIIMEDEEITEVMVNGNNQIYVERKGKIEKYKDTFTTPDKLEDIIQRIASQINRRVNTASPMVDARLKDGSRVNIILPPVSIDGPTVTIRRFPKEPLAMKQLIEKSSLSQEAADFLAAAVRARYNIFISGGTGSGKTTFLGALGEFIPSEERVITIEDSAELRIRNVPNLIRLESRPANLEGDYEVSIRDLVRNALRMRPDRVIIGEIRSGEALDMLQAMNTGHDGSLSTGHGNSAKDMLARIETMCLQGNVDLPILAIREQIASGIDLLVHLSRLRDKSRRVIGIYEIAGIEAGEILLNPLFTFEEEGVHEKTKEIKGTLKRTENLLLHNQKFKANFPEGLKFI